MTSNRCFVIVGAGQSGGWAARTLRDEGFDGRIVLLGEEDFPPYERPPLSKAVLLGVEPPESTYLWPPESYAEWGVELRLGARVARIVPEARKIELADGETLAYDRLMLATGARPRRLAVPGAELENVQVLRAIPDSAAIAVALAPGARVLVVGGGWIGLEVAAAARRLGAEAVVVETQDRLCARALAPDMSEHLLAIHRAQGVEVRLGVAVARFEGTERIAGAVLSDGTTVEASLAVVGIGIEPNVALALEAGLAVDEGVVVDQFGRTSDADIFAAGDVTNHPNPLLGRRVRLESWENAQNQAVCAAKAMLDKGQPYAEIPWFWSDQYDHNIQLVGLPRDWDDEVTRGDRGANAFIVFYLKDGRIDGAAAIGNPRDIRLARRLIAARKPVEAARLADPEIKLQALLKD